jgi:uncharacterized DUF497 family protein
MNLRFEWDPAKARRNWRKHEVRFETAMRAFADPFLLTVRKERRRYEQKIRSL